MFEWNSLTALMPVVMDAALKGVLILIAAGLLTACMRRAAAARRHLVWTLAIVAVLLLPVTSVWLPAWPVLPAWVEPEQLIAGSDDPMRSAEPWGDIAPSSVFYDSVQVEWDTAAASGDFGSEPKEIPGGSVYASAIEDTGNLAPAAISAAGAGAEASAADDRVFWHGWRWVGLVWLTGAGMVLLPMVLGWLRIQHLRWQSQPLDSASWQRLLGEAKARLHVRRSIRLCRSAEPVMPMTWGVLPLGPAWVLLPEHVERWSADRRRLVLLHELGHIKRRDCTTQWLARLACVVYWFNPLVWYAARRMAAERERACDDLVLRCGAPAASYAQQLLEIASNVPMHRLVSCSSVAMARPSTLGSRIRKILDPRQSRAEIGRRGLLLSILFAAVVTGPVMMMTVRAAVEESLAEMPAEQAVVYSTDRFWRSSTWAGTHLHTHQVHLDQRGENPVFHVFEPDRRHVWLGHPDLHVDKDRYPIVIMEYRASGLHPESDNYVIWMDDGTGPSRGGVRVFRTNHLIKDGSLQEVRQDLRELEPAGAINGLALGVRPGPEGPGRFELVSLRFERDPDDEAEYEPIVDAEPIAVRVVDTAGRPLAGVTVTSEATTTNFARAAETDEAGYAQVTPYAHGQETHMLRLEAEGKARMELTGVQPGRAEPIQIVMYDAKRFGGVVQDTEGQPIAGAGVSMLLTAEDVDVPAGAEQVRFLRNVTLLTDEQGRWRTPATHADRVSVRLAHEDYVSDSIYRNINLHGATESDASAGGAVLTMTRGQGLSGLVVNQDEEPIEDARLSVGHDRFGRSLPHARSDATGRFQFEQLPPDETLVVTVRADDYGPELVEIAPGDDREDIRITMTPGARLHGRVLDVDGQPVPEATVSADTWRGNRSLPMSTSTDEQGEFEFANTPSDEVQYDIYKRDMMSVRRYVMTPREAPYEITLHPQLRIHGDVTDADTGEPVPRFEAVRGIVWSIDSDNQPTRPPHWDRQPSSTHTGEGGQYELKLTSPSEGHMVRIEAPGYAPAVSRVFKSDEGDVRYDFELQQAEGLRGMVRNATGEPAMLADVMLAVPGQHVWIQNGRLRSHLRRDVINTRTDTDGRFELLPVEQANARLVVVHEDGYAELEVDNPQDQHDIELTPWARMEGRLILRGEPARGDNVQWNAIRQFMPHEPNASPQVHFNGQTSTDEQGRFTFDRVTMGDVNVSRRIRGASRAGASMQLSTHSLRVETQPERVVTVQLGGEGRPVVGRLTLPDDTDRQVNWSIASGLLQTHIEQAQPPLPEGWHTMAPEETRAWYEQWKETEEGQAYHAQQEARARQMRMFNFPIDRDGRFRAEDIPAGEYRLNVTIHDEPDQPHHIYGQPIGSAGRSFVIEPIEQGYTSEPLDLGEIQAQLRRTLSVGEIAPDFEVEDLDGEPVRLSDYRGQFVLLDFWATWCGPCIAETPNLKRVYEAFGDDGRFELIALSLDQDRESPREYVEANELAWVQGYLGPWNETEVPNQYGVQGIPQIMLIGPDGKVVARNLRGDQIFQVVNESLQGHER